MSETPSRAAANSRCAKCGAEFRCGMEAGDQQCWCASLPSFMPLPAASEPGSTEAGCYCPTCLKEMLRATDRA
jgi:hypothetical protein